ncbi:hypothetical protein QBC44DRAFT_363061 [Cladorrhinum sp. PSN332]|nr:hypothetical protein QBC44DRAFT_363061 [Cladorrhinum sp. PSN332]
MSEPLSTAGSVVGIISLGIQVCDGFVSYLRSVKGRMKDIEDGFRDAAILIPIFYSLHELLPKLPPETSVASIQQCLKDSEEELLAMQKWLVELRGSSDSTTLRGKVEEAGRSVVYPFRQGKLDALRQTLQRLLDSLQTSVPVATLSVAVRSDDRLKKIGTAVEAETRTIASNTAIIISRSEETAKDIKKIKEKVEELAKTRIASPPSPSLHATLQSSTVSTGQIEVRQKHQRGYKFYGIRQPTNRRLKAEMSLPIAWFFRRVLTASVEYATGSSGFGVSNLRQATSPKAAIQLLKETERRIFSFYQERHASPLNRDKLRNGHTEVNCHLFTLKVLRSFINTKEKSIENASAALKFWHSKKQPTIIQNIRRIA